MWMKLWIAHSVAGILAWISSSLVLHRYRNTHGVSKMGNVGMGMVADFVTPHTVYLYCGIMGIHG